MSSQWWYNPGDYYQLDDMSGFKIRASRSRKIPGGQTGNLIVAPERWETQHPQDFVRGVIDDQTVPQARPRQTNQFVIVATFVTAPTPRLGLWVTVDATAGFNVGDKVSVMLDNGDPYYPIVVALQGNQMRLTPVLPHGVGGNFGDPIQNVIVDLGPSGVTFLADDHGGTVIVDDYGDLIGTP